MMVLHDEPLYKYTTINLGGQAKNMFFPKTVEDLMEIMCSTRSKYILGGGSNLLINDNKVFDNVICLREFNTFILHESNGLYQVGAGVRLQTLIKQINEDGYGGIEYLWSVPGLTGGV